LTTEKQKLILVHLIRTNFELITPYAEALTEAHAEGVDDGIEISHKAIEKVFNG
jgi:hypothetical protein